MSTFANGQVPLSQLANIAVFLQSDARSIAEAERDKKIQKINLNMTTEHKRSSIEKILRDPAMNRKSSNMIAKIIQVATGTVTKIRKEMQESGELPRLEKVEFERNGKTHEMKAKRKNREEEQLDRAVEIIEAKIEFKPYGTGMVRIEGIPDNGLHRGPIVINEHVSPQDHNKGPKPSSWYDITPILSCIFHNKAIHGITSRYKLEKFSASILELKFFSTQIKQGMSRKRVTERILKIAYILNGECIMGLSTKH